MLNVQKYLKNNTLESLTENFGVVVTDYPDRVVLNYSMIESPKFHPICDECRALVLSKPNYEILSISFKRFYNYGEDQNSKDFDITKAVCMEKCDGSIMICYHDGNEWQVQSRKRAFAEGETRLGNTFKEVFEKALGSKINDFFELFDVNTCFVFELVSPETRVVKPYQGYFLYPLMAKNKVTFVEEYDSLKEKYFKDNPNIRPLGGPFGFKSLDEILSNLKELPAFDEGYVCLIPNSHENWRIKIKNPSYLAIAHMRGEGILSTKRVIKLVFEQDHEEYLAYFPEDREFFLPYIEAYDRTVSFVHELWDEYGEIENQKEFAIKVKDTPVGGILFSLKKGLTLTEIFAKMTDNYKEALLERMKNGL